MHFQPSKYSVPPGSALVITEEATDYGFLGLSKRQRRDRAIRRAELDEDRAKKAAAKGKMEKAEKYLAKAAKHWAYAEKMGARLIEKGKTSTFTTEDHAKGNIAQRGMRTRATLAKFSQGGASAQDLAAEIVGETDDFETESSGSGTIVGVGVLSAIGIGAYYLFNR
jgi:hypothetical protein